MKKKSLLIIAALLFIIGGVAPAVFNSNIWVILFFRMMLGIGCGIIIPMSTDLCCDFFEGKERTDMLGYVSATVGLSGVLFQMIGGYLANISWKYCFFAYLVSVIFFLIGIFILPEPDRAGKIAAQEGAADARAKLTGNTYVISILFALFYLMWYICPTNGAIVLLGEKIATPGQIGLLFSSMSVASLISSAIFGRVYKILKTSLMPIAYFFSAVGLYLQYAGHSILVFIFGMIFSGLAMGFAVPSTMAKLTGLVPYSAASKVIALGFCGMGIGGFIQPVVFASFGAGGIGRPAFLIGAICSAFLVILILIADKLTPVENAMPAKMGAS